MAQKIPWEVKYKRIVASFPQVVDVRWEDVLRTDDDVFAHLLGDILKSGGRSSKPGKRPKLDRAEALSRLAKISGEDFSIQEFPETFKMLTNGLSVRKTAVKVGLGKSYVQRLLEGNAEPSFEAMEQIAAAFDKKPSFFLEYRIASVVVIIDDFFRDSPESATSWYLQLTKKKPTL